jgi:histidine phosphotransferase ChpT
MAETVDPRLIELLCARLCHDLVGPVSAIGNGVELVTEFGEEMRGEALALIAQSASEAARRLQFFRIAFGSAAGGDGRAVPLAEARARAMGLPLGGKVRLDWPEIAPGQAELSRAGIKLLLNLILVAVDAALGNGTVRVGLAPAGGGAMLFEVVAESPRADLSDDVAAAFAGRIESATPRTAVAAHARVLSAEAGAILAAGKETGRVTLAVRRAGA